MPPDPRALPRPSDVDYTVSREAVLDARLFDLAPNWNEVGEPKGYEVTEVEETTYPERVVSLFQADCAAVRATLRLADGRRLASIVIVRPPLSRRPDDELIELARGALERAIMERVSV